MQSFKYFALVICLGVLLACSGKHKDEGPTPPTQSADYASEASNLGMGLPTSAVQGASNVSILDGSSTVASTTGSALGQTSVGVLTVNATLTSAAASLSNIRVVSWVNGQTQTISSSGTQANGNIVLNSGANYVCVVIYSGSSAYGRCQVMKVNSTTAGSAARVELTWSGTGDVDLHVDDGYGGKHVYFGNRVYNSGGYDIELDVDNVTAYGPENIRFLHLPSTSSFRVFVNYYQGSISQVATVRIFDSGGAKRYEYTHTFSPSDAHVSSSYGTGSWNIGTLQVVPSTMPVEEGAEFQEFGFKFLPAEPPATTTPE